MAELTVRVELRGDTAANWMAVNPILTKYEIAVEEGIIKNRFKIGDGVTAWNDLPYSDDGAPTGGVLILSRLTDGERENLGKAVKGEKWQSGPPPSDLFTFQMVEMIGYFSRQPANVADSYVISIINELENTGIIGVGRAAIILAP